MRKNKIKILYVLCTLLLGFAWNNLSAQCSNCTSDGPLNTLSYARPAYAPEWTTVQSNSVEGRDYMLFNVIKGQIYRWTTYGVEDDSSGLDKDCLDDSECLSGLTCEGLLGSKKCELAFDTQLTLLKGTCSASGDVLAYNRNGLFRNQSMIEWKADFNGTVFLLVNNYDCTTSCDLDGLNCLTTSVKWQRIDSSHCSDCTYSYPTTQDPPETPASAFVNPANSPGWTLTADNDIKAGEFQTFEVDKGKIYRWSTCIDQSFDTQLTLFRGIASLGNCGQFLGYSDDSSDIGTCLSGSKQTVLEWNSDFNGTVTVLLNQYNCRVCGKSPNPTDPYGHCSVSSLEWQRYDCNECLSSKGTKSIDDDLDTLNNVKSGDYYKFDLEKGGQYVFRSVDNDTASRFTGILTLRKGSDCSGEVLKQSEQVTGSHIQQIIFNAIDDMTVELLISGPDCSHPAGKEAKITYQMVYDPDTRFEEYEDENGDEWEGTVFDNETQTVFLDNKVTVESWEDAIQYCEDLEYEIPGSGGTIADSWVLPNINQLYSVVDFNLFDPATSADWVSYITDTSGEGGACTQPTQESDCDYPEYICNEDEVCARNNWYWSSTTVYGTGEFAWGVNMKDGRSYRALKYDYDGMNSTAHRVICVTGVSVFGELDAKRPAEERIFSGWACDKKKTNKDIHIYFEIFYSVDPVDDPGKIKSVLNIANHLIYGGTRLKPHRYGWDYGDTDLFPTPGSLKEFKINSNCDGTAQTTEHAYELDFNDTSNELVNKMRDAITSKGYHYPPYYVTAWAKEWGGNLMPKSELIPKQEIFVIEDLCGDGHVTGSEQCDDGNIITEECAYNTSCIVCDSSCQLVEGYSPHCGDNTIDTPDENCDCGPGYWVIDGGCKPPELGSKRCPGYGTGTESCTICNEICREEILTVPHCGDGYKDPSEACDDGDNSNNNACLNDCTLNVCGDGYIFNTGPGADETCDDGAKNGFYENQCTPGPCCNTTCDGPGPHCGDGIVQREDCSGYTPCVGGIVGANEICDIGADNGKWLTLAEHNLNPGCSSTCDDIAPYCGDGILQSTHEVCDDGALNQDGVYGKCQTDCKAKPRCGDGRVDGPGGDGLTTGPEVCDDGVNNGAYGYCNNSCTGQVECGDAVLQSTHEECDLGKGNFTDYAVDKAYSCCYSGVGDCVTNCTVGRYCGDAVLDDGRDDTVATDLYYRFDEKSGAIVTDYSGNGKNGVASNVIRAYGKYGRGIFIDDSSHPSLERVTGPAVAATTDLTLEAWIFPMAYATDSGYSTIILGSPGYYLSLYHDGSLRAYWYDKEPPGYHSTAGGLIPLRSWTHVAAVWNATELKLYINGALRETVPVTGTGRTSTSTIIGAQSVVRQFQGIIDEVAISARALTVDEIMKHVSGKSGVEYCDDGEGNVPDGTAILDYETTCSDKCEYFNYCGDGIINGPEVCDDGLPGNMGEYNRCNPGCLELGPHCGDGEKNGPEECDKSPGNSDSSGTVWNGSNDDVATCRTDCTWARCGDGILDFGEECDDGILNSDTTPGACRTDCTVSRCGDGVRDPGEECDDGNDIDYDSCTNACLNARCGDGIRKTIDSTTGDFTWVPNEVCDDGNNLNGDYCRSDCQEVTGYCGDGLLQKGYPASEACDNATFGDGIGAYCTGPCTGSGAAMTCEVGCTVNHGACGDGDIDYIAGETCDDGNAINGDYCSYPGCQITGSCGDGKIQSNEACDSCPKGVNCGRGSEGIGGYCVGDCQTNLGECGDGKIQGAGYTTAMYGGTLPTESGWSIDGPEKCDTLDPRVLSLGSAANIGCTSECGREGSCGDGIRQLRFEGCDNGTNNSTVVGGVKCHPGCMSDPKGKLDNADRNLIDGWACDPDHPMTHNTVRLVFTDADNMPIDSKEFVTAYYSEPAIQKICGGGSGHRWEFNPNVGTINWVGFRQPFTVRAYALTPDGVPESDVLIGTKTFTMADICGDGVKEGDEECDDGNSIDTDNCRNDCKLPSCGDGIVSSTATGVYHEICEPGQTTSCVSAGVPNGNGTVACQSDCKGWVTAPNICTKTWNCAARPQVHDSTETGWNSVSSYHQKWDGTQWVPENSSTVYSNVASATECRYKCGTNFEYDFGIVNWKDPAAWSSSDKVSWDPDEGALKFSGYAWNYLNTYIPIDTSKDYYLEYDVMVANGDGTRTYGGTRSFDSSYTGLPGHPGSYDYFTDVGSTAGGTFAPGVWYHRNNSVIGGAPRTGESSVTSEYNKWHTGTAYAKVLIIHGYSTGTTQTTYIKNLKFYPVTGNGCVPATTTFVCNPKPATGTVWTSPTSYTQTWTWNGTNYDWSPVEDSDTNYNTTYAANQCQFKCDTSYHWNESACVYDYATWTCPAKPANSVWNSVGSYAQSWDGSVYTPANDSTTEYNEVPSTTSCRYKCASGYFYSGGACHATTCGDGFQSDTGNTFADEKVYLTMNEATGLIAYDSSGNGNDGALTSTVWTSGKFYGGLDFNGSSSKLDISYTPPTNNFTMMAWVSPDTTHEIDVQSTTGTAGTVGQKYLFYPNQSGVNGGAGISVGTNGVSVYEHGNNYLAPLAVYDGPVSGWTHVAVTYTSKTPRIYINGVLQTTGSTSLKATVYAPTIVGGGYWGYFDGKVDHVRIIAKSLTAAEIKSAMGEFCDDGVNNGTYGKCNTDCTGLDSYCGDGTHDVGHEDCDKGSANSENIGTYSFSRTCNILCEYNPYCGDEYENGGTESTTGCDATKDYDDAEGQETLCDRRFGSANDYYDIASQRPSCNSNCTINATEGSSSSTCQWCGDGVRQSNEDCDPGSAYGNPWCKSDCTKTIIYVKESGGSTNIDAGTRWTYAYRDLQTALDRAKQLLTDGKTTSVDIRVAAGTYKPSFAAGRYSLRLRSTRPGYSGYGWYDERTLYITGTSPTYGPISTSSSASGWYNFTVPLGGGGSVNIYSDGQTYEAESAWFEVKEGYNGTGADYFSTLPGFYNSGTPTTTSGETSKSAGVADLENFHKHFQLMNYVKIYGGHRASFDGDTYRSKSSYPTYISGDMNYSGGADGGDTYNVIRHNGVYCDFTEGGTKSTARVPSGYLDNRARLDGVFVIYGYAYPRRRAASTSERFGYPVAWPSNSDTDKPFQYSGGYPQWIYSIGGCYAHWRGGATTNPVLDNVSFDYCERLHTGTVSNTDVVRE